MRNDCLRSEVWGADCNFTVFFNAGVFFRDMFFYDNFITDRPFPQFCYNCYLTIIGYLRKPALRYLVICYNPCCVTWLFDITNVEFFRYSTKAILRSLVIYSKKPLFR